MSDELKIVTTVSNEAEAEMVAERLWEAGIRFSVRLASGGIRLGAAAARDVCVEEQDLDRAPRHSRQMKDSAKRISASERRSGRGQRALDAAQLAAHRKA